MLADRARIEVKSGNGGRGASSFRRERYVPNGGPDGGDGGRGGHVFLRVDPSVATLMAFRFRSHFHAENGQPGSSRNMTGKQGEDKWVDVPPGTAIIDNDTGELIVDMTEPGQIFRICKGGRGGSGNARFATSTRQAPRIAEIGEPCEERWIRLELKLIADVGIVGFPNAGKSTLLAAASAARPKVADYPFTTLEPTLGAVEVGGIKGDVFVLADIPGLIEGAAEGVGLGHAFLRHIERTRMLIHMIDGSGGLEGRDPIEDFLIIERELADYADELRDKPRVLAINKIDMPEAQEQLARIHEALDGRIEQVFEISGVTGQGVSELMAAVSSRLRDIPREVPVPRDHRVYGVDQQNEMAWEADRISRAHYEVRGVKLERALLMTDFGNPEAADRFQRVLEASGVSARLTKLGIQPGHIVHIAGSELVWDQAVFEADKAADPVETRKTHRERIEANFGDGVDTSALAKRQIRRHRKQRKP